MLTLPDTQTETDTSKHFIGLSLSLYQSFVSINTSSGRSIGNTVLNILCILQMYVFSLGMTVYTAADYSLNQDQVR